MNKVLQKSVKLNSYPKLNLLIILCVWVFCPYLYVCSSNVCPSGVLRGPGTGETASCMAPSRCWELSRGPLEEQCSLPLSYLSSPVK